MGQSDPKLSRVAQKSAQWPKIAEEWPISTKRWPKTASGGPKWATNDGPGHGVTLVLGLLGFWNLDSGRRPKHFGKKNFLRGVGVWGSQNFLTPLKMILSSRLMLISNKNFGPLAGGILGRNGPFRPLWTRDPHLLGIASSR